MFCSRAGLRGIDTVGQSHLVFDNHLFLMSLIYSIVSSMTPDQLLMNDDDSDWRQGKYKVRKLRSQRTTISKNGLDQPLLFHWSCHLFLINLLVVISAMLVTKALYNILMG